MTAFKVLLVENEQHWQKILHEDIQQALSEIGHSDNPIENAKTVEQARKALEHEGPWDLLVTDLILPSESERGGMELVEQAHQLGIPTIVISAVETSEAFWNSLSVNEVYNFFSKGVYYTRIKEFILKVKKILKQESKQQSLLLPKYQQRRRDFEDICDKAKNALDQDNIDTFQSETDKLTELLCQALTFKQLEDTGTLDQLYGRMIDASNSAFKLNIRSKFPVIYACQTEFGQEDVPKAIGLLNSFNIYADFFALFVVFSDARQLGQKFHESVYKNDFIVLDGDQFWDILAAKSPIQRLTNYILEQIDLLAVSPYTTAGPVSEKMFFGRAVEEKTLLQNISRNNYALLANRKIGKTSLLNRIFPRLKGVPYYQVFKSDLQAASDYKSFYEELTLTYPEFEEEIIRLTEPSPSDFRKVIRQLRQSNGNRQIILIFDEVDELLAYDLQFKERLFKTFRSLSQQENVRFIFSGSTTLVKRSLDPDSPLFNFCQPIKLQLLDEKSALELVTVPMSSLGVQFDNQSAIVQYILSITARHPNLIQYICDLLIKRINDKQRRIITEEELELVVNSQEFYEYFENLFWGQSQEIDKLLIYLMWSYQEFTETQVIEQFAQRGLATEGVKDSLETLQIYSILSKKNDKYFFTFREFAKLIEKRSDIGSLQAEYLQKVGGVKT